MGYNHNACLSASISITKLLIVVSFLSRANYGNLAASEQPIQPPASSTVRTTNFVVDAPTARVARLIACNAEELRARVSKKWLGNPLPDWNRQCQIHITLTEQSSDGRTEIIFHPELAFKVFIRGTLDSILANLLPHHVSHTILASHFKTEVPLWADEGIAVLNADEDEMFSQAELATKMVKEKRMISLSRFFAMNRYLDEPADRVAQATSIVRFLIKQKDHAVLLAFIKDGMTDQWDKSAKTHYGFETIGDLEQAWMLSFVAIDASSKRTPAKNELETLISSVPIAAKATFCKEKNLLMVRRPITRLEPAVVSLGCSQNDKLCPIPGALYRTITTLRTDSFDLDCVEAFDVENKRLDKGRLKKLQDEAVLLSSDGKKVDPHYLQLIKTGTLVLVIASKNCSSETLPVR